MGTGLAGGMRFVCMNDSCFTKPFERWRMACGMRCVRRYASCEDNCSLIHRDSESSNYRQIYRFFCKTRDISNLRPLPSACEVFEFAACLISKYGA
jgi:hypothetical protein